MNQEFTIKQQMNDRTVTLIYHGLRLEGALVILRKMISCAEQSAYLQGLNMKLAPIKLLEPEFLVQKPNIKSFFIEFLATIYLAFIVGVVKHFLYKTRDRNWRDLVKLRQSGGLCGPAHTISGSGRPRPPNTGDRQTKIYATALDIRPY